MENSVENDVRPAPKFWAPEYRKPKHYRGYDNCRFYSGVEHVESTPVSNMLSGPPMGGARLQVLGFAEHFSVSLTSRGRGVSASQSRNRTLAHVATRVRQASRPEHVAGGGPDPLPGVALSTA